MLPPKSQPTQTPNTEPTGRITVLAQRRERLAIISTRNKLCGIAAYTAALEKQLADVFDLTVFDLDQYLLRSKHARLRALANRHIKEICRDIADFDVVNLQLEYGTLGVRRKDIYRRFCWLVAAAPRLSITFHSFKRPPAFRVGKFAKAIATLKWQTAFEIVGSYFHDRKLALGFTRRLRREQRRKPVSMIVHNQRDLSDAQHLFGFERVFDHPLVFLSEDEAIAINRGASRRRFPLLDQLSREIVLIGIFGFLSDYKGFESAIRALHHLPANHHLLIFGGTHPNEILSSEPIHPYIKSLLKEGNVDTTLYEQIMASPKRRGVGLNLDIEHHLGDLVGVHPRDLSDRIHFMGASDNADFLSGMAICDAVVFPYLEVGQSSSGPISQAIELGRRVIASRTHTFLQFAAYHPNTIEFFDIGNHLELAGRISARPQYADRREKPRYTVETNKATYLAANSASATEQRFRRQSIGKVVHVSRNIGGAA